jgi:GT2 family glycosyltransferase
VDVLVPTYGRPAALAVTLTGLVGQAHRPRRVVVSDQTEGFDAADAPEVRAAAAVLTHLGVEVQIAKHLPRRGMAEQRQFLLDQARSPYALFLDDDVILEPDVLARMVAALQREGCGFVGAFVDAPSAVRSTKPIDQLPPELAVEWWDGPVAPESVGPGSAGWERRHLHFAAYLHQLCRRDGIDRAHERLYKVAWVGGCVLYDVAKLRDVGGFLFWDKLPNEHCGEDALAQLRTMARYGGAALAPSGAWHQEVPTTCHARDRDAPLLLAGPLG